MWDAPTPYEDNNPYAQPYQSDRFAYDYSAPYEDNNPFVANDWR